MHQLGTEEQTALLLSAAADDDDEDNDNHNVTNAPLNSGNDGFPVVVKRPKTYQRHPISNAHPILCFACVLGAFILGCLTGVIILLDRISHASGHEQTSLPSNFVESATNIDLSIRAKLFQSIKQTNFMDLTRSIESENDAANKLYEQWKSYSPSLTHINKLTYDINLSKFAPSTQWSGIQLFDDKNDKELLKVDLLPTENFLFFSSLVKSGIINGKSIYYVNYGRQEDFAYLFKNRIHFKDPEKSIVFMRRKPTLISQTEQIHQAIYYGFGALVLFDDNENAQITTTNDRHTFFRGWARYLSEEERQKFIDGTLNDDNHFISLLIISYDDVQKIFQLLQSNSNPWLMCPTQWHDKVTALRIGGELSTMRIRVVVNIEPMKIELPVVMSSIRGTIDTDRFIMIGYQLGTIQQNRIMNEIIEAYTNQIKNGWNPRRSILFCAWSGLDYDHYTTRRWLSDNYRFIDKNLIAYLDLGNGVLANSTLNLHGSPLLEQVASRAANFVPSPIEHNHTCHNQLVTTTVSTEENHHHGHDRKRRASDGHEQHVEKNQQEQTECEPQKLFDEWVTASKNQIGLNNILGIVQTIDIDSSAALFQLQYGIPSILIEMTNQQALTNDTFYVCYSSPVFEREIQPEVYVAYTQFVTEIIRQLIDEPLISFNLAYYANQIDKQVIQYIEHYNRGYGSVGSHIGDPSDFTITLNDLTKSIRKFQLYIDQLPKNDYFRFQSINEQLIEFERLFLSNDHLPGMNTIDKIYKHILIGPAFGLTNTAVPFPLLSNLLFGIPEDPSTEICEASKLFWLKLKEHIHVINRTLIGFDGLMEKF
ncbi:unnamed protein product [Rotaria sp. Silwood2]|nr:unnamed protein product [Rotaria sp. Silwood2]